MFSSMKMVKRLNYFAFMNKYLENYLCSLYITSAFVLTIINIGYRLTRYRVRMARVTIELSRARESIGAKARESPL